MKREKEIEREELNGSKKKKGKRIKWQRNSIYDVRKKREQKVIWERI